MTDILKFILSKPTERQTIQRFARDLMVDIFNAKGRGEVDFQPYYNQISQLFRYSHHHFEVLSSEWMKMINEPTYFASEWLNKLKADEKYSVILTSFIKAVRIKYQQLGNNFKIGVK